MNCFVLLRNQNLHIVGEEKVGMFPRRSKLDFYSEVSQHFCPSVLSFAKLDHDTTFTCGLYFSTGLVRGFLSGVAVDVGGNIAKQSDPSNGSQKPKAMTLL